jgi:hypothetical protein
MIKGSTAGRLALEQPSSRPDSSTTTGRMIEEMRHLHLYTCIQGPCVRSTVRSIRAGQQDVPWLSFTATMRHDGIGQWIDVH